MRPTNGFTIGAIAAVAGGLGTLLSGVVAIPAGGSVSHPPPPAIAAWWPSQYLSATYRLSTREFLQHIVSDDVAGPIFATGEDHVLPRMRGMVTALESWISS